MAFIKVNKKGLLVSVVIILALLIDQIIKIEVKTGMPLGGQIHITDWFYIKFIENNGMAYGMTFINKPVLSVFRIVLISLLGWYICRQVKTGARTFYIIVLGLVFAGALGNLIDCMLYSVAHRLISHLISSRLEKAIPASLQVGSWICFIFR